MRVCPSATVSALCIILLAQGGPLAMGDVNQQAIDDVAAGKIKEARASWWGFDPADATEALQAAINCGVEKLVVDNVGEPWIVRPITLASDQEILFEEGVEVLAKKCEFTGGGACLFTASQKANITLLGYGATFRMRRSDYDDPELYSKAEWRHCLSIRSCTNIKVYGLTLAESGGDGIYLGTAEQWVTNKDIHIKDVICDRNYRQGISVITAENLLIENTILRDTGGTPPQAGIDFEPNHPQERLVNCVMCDCLIENNNGNGIVMYLPALKAASEPASLRFENCRCIGDRGSARVITGGTAEGAVDGSIEFVSCVFEDSEGTAIAVSKPADRCPLRFVYCSILSPAQEAANQTPIMFLSRQGATEPVGGVEFVACLIRDPLDRNPMSYVDAGGGVPLKDISGTLILEEGGAQNRLTLTDELLAEWMPVIALKDIPRLGIEGVRFEPLVRDAPAEAYSLQSARLRKTGRLVVYAERGDEVTFRLRHLQVGRYAGKAIPVVVAGPSGPEVARAEAPFTEETEVAFTAPETGIYRITADAGQNLVQIVSSSHPMNLNGESGLIRLIHSAGDYVFWVPSGTTEFGVRVAGEGAGEAIRAALIDPTGKVVEEVDNTCQVHQVEVTLPKPSEGEAWTLRLSRPSELAWEDHYVDLRGIPPLLAPSREALLAPVD